MADLVKFINYGYEPGVPVGSNLALFGIDIAFNGGLDEFQVKYTRLLEGVGYLGDGKIAFGVIFEFGKDIYINGEIQSVFFKLFDQEEATLRKDMTVIWFCLGNIGSCGCP